ncbi:MAG: efflux RND transporter periplasmic adaptor subunit [Cytophagaceae bacterium]
MKKILFIVGGILLVGLIVFQLYSNKKAINESKQVVDRTKIPVAVSVATVEEKALSSSFQLPATLAPFEESTISVTVSGKIEKLSIENGSYVRKGQIIGAIDARVKQLNLEAVELSLDKLKRDYERTKELYEGKAATETNMLDAKYAYDNKRIEAEQLRRQIADANIVAPFTGVISNKKLNAGEFTNVGSVIATIVNIDKLKAIVYVNEKDAYRLKLGQNVTVNADVYAGQDFKGKITFISPKGDDSHNYMVEVLIDNNGKSTLKAGTYVMVQFQVGGSSNALQIPKIALAEGVKNPYVYIINGNTAELRKVVVGREVGEYIEVISGLQQGEKVVVNGQINLINGSLINIVGK